MIEGPGPPPQGMTDAYELGLKGQPSSMTKTTLMRILSERKPNNWMKWWRRGYIDGERQRGAVLVPPFTD